MDAQFYNRFSISWFHLLLMVLLSMAAAQGIAAETAPKKEPEVVYVAVEKARIYAGPSSDFYPTGDSQRGTALEVYHRTENGWLGIRPPQGSFSWVPASQAYLLPGGRVIEVTDSNSVSWIGTELGSAKQYRWQVQLKVGEQLTVLGEATIKNGTDEREALWYKVAPPAGEFRWIEQAAVSKTAPPVKATAQSNESKLVSKAVESPSETTKSKKSELSIVEGKGNVPGKAAVQSASFESPAANETSSPNRLPANSRKTTAGIAKNGKPSGKNSSRENEWDGWYAFEMSEQGVRTPFLDKLSGRDRGKSNRPPQTQVTQHDPLIHDPFSLAMAGESPKPSPSELNTSTKRQREWRDPRSLREARLVGSSESLGSPESSRESIAARRGSNTQSNVSNVQLASTDNVQNVGQNVGMGAVNTAGYDRNAMQRPNIAQNEAKASMNWYGLNEGAQSNLPSPLNVVTSTADVGELQLALNNAVASSNGPWNLAPLAERARYLIEHGPTAIDRGQARLLLERIDAFQNVSARTQQFTGAAPLQTNPVQSTSFNAATQNLSLPNSPQTAAANYDATGWLVPVHAAGPDQPTHALTNDTGDVVAYVSPIAGLNLDRYRNQAVGINGLRGYLPQLQAAHIQAQRVSRVR